jgi:general stress protein YciG
MADKDTKGKRGFASMDPEKRREIARRGGRTVHGRGTGYTFTQEEQRKGGERGGRALSQNRAYMAEIGRRGGISRQRQRAKAKAQKRKKQ